jgi:hypothetical protein
VPDFHALYWHLGPFGRQDVHLHPCLDRRFRNLELVGSGRDCDPRAVHVEMRLGSAHLGAGRDGEPLAT